VLLLHHLLERLELGAISLAVAVAVDAREQVLRWAVVDVDCHALVSSRTHAHTLCNS
jgi:hypothetical protein